MYQAADLAHLIDTSARRCALQPPASHVILQVEHLMLGPRPRRSKDAVESSVAWKQMARSLANYGKQFSAFA